MTLAVAARFPWPELLDSLPGHITRILEIHPRFRPEPAILMAADSRWTWTSGTTDDGGVKVAAVDTHAAATYAGDTLAGEKALAYLSQAFSQARQAGPKACVEPERILQYVWSRRADKRGGLQVCLAGAFNSELAVLRFDHHENFRAKPVVGVAALGWPDACDFFLQRLEEEVSNEMSVPLSEKPLALSAEHWWGLIARLVVEACEEKVHASVGGPITGAIVTKSGVQGRSIYRIDLNASKPEADRLSLSPEDVAEFYKRNSRQRPRFVKSADRK